jgi:hypothetical protein
LREELVDFVPQMGRELSRELAIVDAATKKSTEMHANPPS